MTGVIIIEKDKINEVNIDKMEELYKKCKFKKVDNFIEINSWKYNNIIIKLFGKTIGKNTSKNLYEFGSITEDSKTENILYGPGLANKATKRTMRIQPNIAKIQPTISNNVRFILL